MSEVIYIRGASYELKRTLAVQAGLYGLSLSEYCLCVLEDSTRPHDDLVDALIDRAEEVEQRKTYSKVHVLAGEVPHPRAVTQPVKGEKEWML